MKFFRNSAVLVAVLVLNIGLANAQLLPNAGTGGCDDVLSSFENNYTILNDEKIKKGEELNKASSDYEAVNQQFEACNNGTETNTSNCSGIVDKEEEAKKEAKKKADEYAADNNDTPGKTETLLGCAIKTGRVSLQMVPYFIKYIADWLLSLVGLICVLFIVIGGYQYVVGGLTDQKEKGKKTIQHALMGMSVAILSWIIVGIVLNAVTG